MLKEFFKKAYAILKDFKKPFIVLVVFIVVSETLQLVQPYLFKEIIDSIVKWQELTVQYVIFLLSGLLIAYLVTTAWSYQVDKRIFRILYEVERYLLTRAQKKLVELSLGYHEKENTGSKISKIQRGVDRILELIGNLYWELIPTAIQVIVTFVFLLFLNWQISLVFLSVVPIFILLTFWMNKKAYPLRIRRHYLEDVAYGKMGQSVININTVQSYAQEKREFKEFKHLRDWILRIGKKEYGIILNLNLFREMAIDIGRILVLIASVYLVIKGRVSVGSLVLFLTLSEKTYFSLFRISRIYDRVSDASAAVNRLLNLMGKESEIKDNPKAKPVIDLKGEVIFDNVSFHYLSKEPVLKDISFKVSPGQTIALVGPSGGGKSTIVKLIFRHYDSVKGRILIDGENIRNLKLSDYRQFLGYVSQDVEIFDDTIKNNIAYGKKEANMREIKKAAKKAFADEFINRFENGYDTTVGERGIKLSGGQKQRIGIARAILRQPKIMVFDEATSNMDTISERLIQKSIEEMARDTTMIVIAHRLSTIRHADRILVIENGRLTEEGNHEELKKQGLLYAKLLSLQAAGDIR
ncbi:MAG: hypothetical protein COY66_03510 [Candidatus Kerfeldbacteria bacterium CG_4_10_14_0_8_um_filter_42_10]|uniref:ABC transporter ATP-binding protein n=1 Tax=Candidatus Kerfeldbacteria bacterium CG_4_10_14_0_8_um_filter_42_10 TaxID=2014248 RepID=A0A2M7RIU9_9BACT|nr:MAG: hypothetical protein COY66_03510 [Candidatus Kerfeldbacteria bacterium CG_4_10_14_0_8_um_filter_42_10]